MLKEFVAQGVVQINAFLMEETGHFCFQCARDIVHITTVVSSLEIHCGLADPGSYQSPDQSPSVLSRTDKWHEVILRLKADLVPRTFL